MAQHEQETMKLSHNFDHESAWQAVLTRDEKFDGEFVYGVLSTRIFCRPSCPSRRPKRAGAQFFESVEEATRAGFRACKRCLPELPASTRAQRVRAMCRMIEAHEGAVSLKKLGEEIGGSPFHLQRLFKQTMGITPREYSQALRLGRIKTNLQNGETTMNALFDSGYGSGRALYESAPSQLGMTPATYGRGGAGAQIRFYTAPCSLGFLLVAVTEKGICSVALGDSVQQLEENLRAEFPAAHILPAEEELSSWVQRILLFLEGREPHLNLPLDVRATAFQWRVWQELREISAGETRSYSQVARALGQPTAARAVARACATNPVALIIPCHRVVRGGGALSGYRWGLERKKKLLEQEQENA
jgi:AraC family transcriptional regulator of adaptative response/methylated-DNA-[protein]-cysteine methyltransferase